MSNQKFDPGRYKNKKTIYVSVPGVPGVNAIWDWSGRRKKYCKRTLGNKFYSVKRIGGRQTAKCFTHLNEAKLWQHDLTQALEPEDYEMLFCDLKEKFFKKKKGEILISTYESYESKAKHLKYFDKMLVSSITPRVVDAWIEHLKTPKYLKRQHRSRVSYRHELDVLRTILDFYGEYICEDNSYNLPFKKRHKKDCIVDKVKYKLAKDRNKRKFIPRETVLEFLGEMKKTVQEKPEYEVFMLLALFQFSTGTRIGEACAVNWSDLNLENGKAIIHRSVCWSRKAGRKTFVSDLTKTGERRTVFLPIELVEELKAWALKSGRRKGLVFSDDGLNPLGRRAVQYHYNNALKKTGCGWTGTHLLRHSFATDFLEQTQNPKALQGILGHQTAQQTNYYSKITDGLMQKGMDQYQGSYSDFAKVINIGGVRKMLGS